MLVVKPQGLLLRQRGSVHHSGQLSNAQSGQLGLGLLGGGLLYAQADNLGVDSAMNSDAYPPVQDTYDAYPPDGGFGGEGNFA